MLAQIGDDRRQRRARAEHRVDAHCLPVLLVACDPVLEMGQLLVSQPFPGFVVGLRGGSTLGRKTPGALRWKTNTTQSRSQPSRSLRACSKSWQGKSSMVPRASPAAYGWRGVLTRSGKGVRTTPMGESVMGVSTRSA